MPVGATSSRYATVGPSCLAHLNKMLDPSEIPYQHHSEIIDSNLNGITTGHLAAKDSSLSWWLERVQLWFSQRRQEMLTTSADFSASQLSSALW